MPSFLVFFESGKADLTSAAIALAGRGLEVNRDQNGLVVFRGNGPRFRVVLTTEDYAREEAEEIGEGTPYAAAMKRCDIRFEVMFNDLDEALDEINTMIEVQAALQEVSGGYLFLPWNATLTTLEVG